VVKKSMKLIARADGVLFADQYLIQRDSPLPKRAQRINKEDCQKSEGGL
jgi:hypothetical protein